MKVPKWGLIDKTGAWLIEPKIDYVDAFRDGIAKVVIDGKCGYIDKTGTWIIEPKFDDAKDFVDGVAFAKGI